MLIKLILNPKILLILGIASAIGVVDIGVGMILDDLSYWFVSDVFVMGLFGILAVFFLYNWKTKPTT